MVHVVVLATPNNPTGTAPSVADLRRVVDAAHPSTVIVIDEAYLSSSIRRSGIPCTSWSPASERRRHARTFSKAHGLAGVRVGYAVGHPDTSSRSIDKTLFPFAVNALAQAVAIAAIDGIDEIEGRVAAILVQRQRVVTALQAAGTCRTPRRTSSTCRSAPPPTTCTSGSNGVVW